MGSARIKKIGVVTVARSDYGIYRSLLQRITSQNAYELRLYVTGAHLSPEFGLTIKDIEKNGFPIFERIEMLISGDTPESIAKSMGLGVIGFSQAFAKDAPDILVVLGDRFEMFAATSAAVPFNIPIAHIHGGEITTGAIDDVFRHAITKMSHLHFTSTQEYADRVIQMGEDPRNVTVSGAPGLDGLKNFSPFSRNELESRFSIRLDPAPLLVTFHPVTREYEDALHQTEILLAALKEAGMPIVFTAPNADTAGRAVRDCIRQFVLEHENAAFVENFGRSAYFSVLPYCAAMVGNSSSGIIEAASFGLPVVNIGNRQQGRAHGENVIDVPAEKPAVGNAIRKAASPAFRKTLEGFVNPYHPNEKDAAEIIFDGISRFLDRRDPVDKQFVDL